MYDIRDDTNWIHTQDWASYNKAQTTEKSHFLACLYELRLKIDEPIQKRKRGGQPLPLAKAARIFGKNFSIPTVSSEEFLVHYRKRSKVETTFK